jgi:hypothetical protein
MGKAIVKFKDFDNEGSNVAVRIVDLTAGNIAAQIALVDTLETALAGVTRGAVSGRDVLASTREDAYTLPVDGDAQRETKWLVSGVDSEGFNCSLEIPTADLTLLTSGTKNLSISAGAGAALADALNDMWRSKQGNAVTVTSIIHVSRNT